MLVAATPTLLDCRVVKVLGAVTGLTVRNRDVDGKFLWLELKECTAVKLPRTVQRLKRHIESRCSV